MATATGSSRSRSGERLFAAAPEPKRFVTLPGVDHVSVLEAGGLGPVRAFLDAVERTAS